MTSLGSRQTRLAALLLAAVLLLRAGVQAQDGGLALQETLQAARKICGQQVSKGWVERLPSAVRSLACSAAASHSFHRLAESSQCLCRRQHLL